MKTGYPGFSIKMHKNFLSLDIFTTYFSLISIDAARSRNAARRACNPVTCGIRIF